MFEGWDGFYLLIGGAAGGLIGLLFVVATLTTGVDKRAAQRGSHLYMTPVVFHVVVVMVISALACAPRVPTLAIGLALGAAAAIGLGYTLWIIVNINKPSGLPEPTHWSDRWFYGVAPAAAYMALAWADASIGLAPKAAPYLIATVLLALLLLAIRNAWDLVTYLAPRAGGE